MTSSLASAIASGFWTGAHVTAWGLAFVFGLLYPLAMIVALVLLLGFALKVSRKGGRNIDTSRPDR